MIIGWIILAVAVLGLLAALIYMFVRSGFPPYKFKTEGKFDFVKSRLWAQDEVCNKKLPRAYDVARAAWAVNKAWGELGLPEQELVKNTLREVGFLLVTDQDFHRWSGLKVDNIASVSVWTKDKIYSRNIPVCAVKLSTILDNESRTGNSLDGGQPMIHEMIHAVAERVYRDFDRYHKDDVLWKQIQERAQKIYLTWT
jgi:hypothetical protein